MTYNIFGPYAENKIQIDSILPDWFLKSGVYLHGPAE
jgi:hypothetical protein